MKKFFIFGAVAIVLSFAVALGAKSYRTTHNTLFYANLDALANPEGDNEGGGDGGSNPGGGGGTDPGEGGTSKFYEYGVYIKRVETIEIETDYSLQKCDAVVERAIGCVGSGHVYCVKGSVISVGEPFNCINIISVR